ncbi:NAD(P)-dependent oxidoreductase [Chitinophaga sp. HK235]|uniref:NAD-dependent epimerase/dehydratase family protein n=1 Tax=Chitinophaga sp. HK235 TaxID=2952571 RepID=UPI001BA4AEF8|nr:NAD(P)-dependent oxidoreductase [Chitinophaga sp. HK235]
MRILVTGSSGHLGEALVRSLTAMRYNVRGLDRIAGPFTTDVGCLTEPGFVQRCMKGVETVFHAATLHKPHVETHSIQQFIDTNVSGTLNLLQASVAAGVKRFVFTSTTSVFGEILAPPQGQPAIWITPEVMPVPKNIYGITKVAAEDLCRLFNKKHKLPCIVLRTSRFFPEADDSKLKRDLYEDANLKVNEYLFRRIDLEDVVSAHLAAAERAEERGFAKYVISATTPFSPEDAQALQIDAPAVVQKYFRDYQPLYTHLNWKMQPSIERVYDNAKARMELGWKPVYDFGHILMLLKSEMDFRSPLAQQVGSKGYHDRVFEEGPYPVS